jgi:hypothetical protein
MNVGDSCVAKQDPRHHRLRVRNQVVGESDPIFVFPGPIPGRFVRPSLSRFARQILLFGCTFTNRIGRYNRIGTAEDLAALGLLVLTLDGSDRRLLLEYLGPFGVLDPPDEERIDAT